MSQEAPAQPDAGQTPLSEGTALSEGTYEFGEDENVSIERTGASSTIWAVCAIVGAVLLGTLAAIQFFLDNVRGAILVLPLFLVCLVAGWLYLGVGRALKEVVTTEGNDVELLMRALDSMGKAFRNEVIATGVAVVLFVALAFATRM
jgi:hypothetical protein